MRIIEELKDKFIARDIETAFVIYYVTKNAIVVENNLLINSFIKTRNERIIEIEKVISSYFKKINIYDLVKVFELLIADEDKKINGSFFTPHSITRFIVNETVKSKSLNICDPSCGCGAFLIEAANKIYSDFGGRMVKIIENNLYGVDIADYSVRRAKVLLTLLALEKNEDVKDISFNIQQNDSLETDWKILFPEIFTKGGFDIVIGNPPYVKFQDLPNKLRKKLYENWLTLKKGNYNLYFAFFELGTKILKSDGNLAYITPNNYFTSLAGFHLREFLAQNKYLYKIIDFDYLKVFDVQTYTCITLLNKVKKDNFLYERIENLEALADLNKLTYSTIYFSALNNKKWRLLRIGEQENIKKIENTGIKLGNMFDIRVGIATLKDSLYFIEGTTYEDGYYKKYYNGKIYLIEAEVTKPIAKISDFKTQKDLGNNTRRIIYPYKKTDGKVEIISEEELKSKYQECYKYLLAAKEELSNRDKGKIDNPNWYAYGRTQGLNFLGQKLLTPTFSSKPRFLYEKNPEALFCNGYAIYLKEEKDLFSNKWLNLDLISKILNSKVMEYYIARTSVSIEGGYPCYQKNFIELFGVPNISHEEIEYLKKVNDKGEIDKFLIKKYKIRI